MKKLQSCVGGVLLTVIFMLSLFVNQLIAQTETFTTGNFTTWDSDGQDYTWPVPTDVTSITVIAIGGGGGGGAVCQTSGWHITTGYPGGGGGAWVKSTIAVNPGENLTIHVGSKGSGDCSKSNTHPGWGGASWVARGGNILVKAAGAGDVGDGASANAVGQGGQASACIGQEVHAGGNGGPGASGAWCKSGGGGAAGGGNGGNGSAGTTSLAHAGNGAGSVTSHTGGTAGENGNNYGGGGSGGATGLGVIGGGFTALNGGDGAPGIVVITYTVNCNATAGAISAENWVCTVSSPPSPSDTSCIIISTTDASSSVGGTYLWQSSPDHSTWTTIPNTNSKQYTATATGYYRRGYAVSGCTTVYTDYVQVTRPSNIDPGTLKDGDNKIEKEVCAGGSVNVTLSKTYSGNVQWQTSTDKVNWTNVSTASTYTISVTSATTTTYVRYIVNYTPTCDIPSNNIYTVTVNPLPVVNSITAPTDKCPGQSSYTVSANLNYTNDIVSYTWTNATGTGATATITPTLPNCGTTYTYYLKVTDNKGCESAVQDGSFTTESPTMSFGTIGNVTAAGTNCVFTVPALEVLTDSVNKALTSTCGNTVTLDNFINYAPGDEITSTTDVTATATDMCGNTQQVTIRVVKPDAPKVSITAAKQYLCPGETTKLSTNVTAEEPSYAWDPTSLGTKDTAITIAYTTEDKNVHADRYSVKVTDKYGCEVADTIDIYTTPKAYIANQTHTVCTPNSVTFAAATGDKIPATSTTIGTYNFTSTTTYSWTITSNTGVTGASAGTDQANFTTGTLTNGELTTQTVVYTVVPKTTTTLGGTEVSSCEGDAFTVTVNVKPTITTAGAIDPFDDVDVIIILWYGACDTLYYVNAPAYTNNTDLTDVLSNNKATVNEGTTLLGRIAPGEYTIIWTVTDECGNHVDFPKKYIVRYPNCGDADPNYTEPYYAVDADDNVYHTVRIGCECWTASNLKTVTGAPNSMVYKCNDYPNETENEEKYGRLYTWYTAVNVPEGDNTTEPTVSTAAYSTYPYVHGICPTGWAIPSTDNFNSMVNIAGGVNAVKSSSNLYWLPGAEGNDASGFGARGAGYYDSSAERFMNLMGETYFWTYETSSSYGGKCAVISYYCPELLIQDKLKGMGYSIRCIRRENP